MEEAFQIGVARQKGYIFKIYRDLLYVYFVNICIYLKEIEAINLKGSKETHGRF